MTQLKKVNAVCVSVDIGHVSIPVPLPDAAIAYSVTYFQGDRTKADLTVRYFTVADAQAQKSPMDVFDELVTSEPGMWNTTYADISELTVTDPVSVEDELHTYRFIYDPLRYDWRVQGTQASNWMQSFAFGRTSPPIAETRTKRNKE